MFHKGKLLVFLGSFLIVLYGASAAFYGKVVAEDEAYKELSVFMDVLERVKHDYVEVPDMGTVHAGAMRGLMAALDPYSSFLTKEQHDALQKRNAEGKAATGIILSKRSDVVYIVAVAPESPAAAAGIRPGDYVIGVNGEEVEEKSVMEVESYLRGAAGTKIKLSIFRASRSKPQDVELTLQPPSATPVASRMLDGGVGLLDVSSLADGALEQAKVKLKTLVSAGARKMIVDLRDCADGTPADGATLANYFIKSGTIYFSQNRKGEKTQVIEASPERHVTDLPLAVLIDGSTAGAAEIVAGAVKDLKRGTVVGEKSFGVGSSQQAIQLKSGALLILSTAKYCTPSGKVIQDETVSKTGIVPDVQAPDEDQRQDLAVESYYDGKEEGVKSRQVPDRMQVEKDREELENYRHLQERIEKIQLEKAIEILAKGAQPAKKAA